MIKTASMKTSKQKLSNVRFQAGCSYWEMKKILWKKIPFDLYFIERLIYYGLVNNQRVL